MKYLYYQTNIGIFFKLVANSYYHNSNSYRYNGEIGHNLKQYKGWLRIDSQSVEDILVEEKKCTPSKQTGWELKDASLASESIPLSLTMNDLYTDPDEGAAGPEKHLYSLYSPVMSIAEGWWEPIAVEWQMLGEYVIDNAEAPEKMSVTLSRDSDSWDKKEQDVDLESVVSYEEIEAILTPEFLLHSRPCTLSSKTMYRIVRAYVQKHINGANAKITSDYDFCFTVKRLLKHPPVPYRAEKFTPKGNSYKPPKFVTKHSTFSEKEIFEMTWAGYCGTGGYKGYTCIPPLKANNLKEMKEHLKQYLDELMYEINKDSCLCPTCGGHGEVVNKQGFNYPQ